MKLSVSRMEQGFVIFRTAKIMFYAEVTSRTTWFWAVQCFAISKLWGFCLHVTLPAITSWRVMLY